MVVREECAVTDSTDRPSKPVRSGSRASATRSSPTPATTSDPLPVWPVRVIRVSERVTLLRTTAEPAGASTSYWLAGEYTKALEFEFEVEDIDQKIHKSATLTLKP